ncbi:hypothetical protein ABT337_19490 [Saccharopolyspora hirsuta]|uniref:PE domain-containing protein n=1 Tax=Saccharopolyspora hirsuta TaxID=1837 RepID=A0A5M7BUC7_SACHI|nr:hypothetical protein [Saccharopolyspora hirsuta]KAA5833399.1 hypothetical protein F1721_13980 [Saccharopolyspora hirsuta]MBF6507928.1 hypothetical protein [Nocardia farcinica]
MADAHMAGSLGDAVGFAGAGAALGAIRQENNQLSQQISAGRLRMNPESANKAAAVYERMAEDVDDLVQKADALVRVEGLGDYNSGQQLAQKFVLKAKNGSTGAADLLGQLRDELLRKADLLREAAKDYIATDEQIAEDLQRGSQA